MSRAHSRRITTVADDRRRTGRSDHRTVADVGELAGESDEPIDGGSERRDRNVGGPEGRDGVRAGVPRRVIEGRERVGIRLDREAVELVHRRGGDRFRRRKVDGSVAGRVGERVDGVGFGVRDVGRELPRPFSAASA